MFKHQGVDLRANSPQFKKESLASTSGADGTCSNIAALITGVSDSS